MLQKKRPAERDLAEASAGRSRRKRTRAAEALSPDRGLEGARPETENSSVYSVPPDMNVVVEKLDGR